MNLVDAIWRPYNAVIAANKKKNLAESIGMLVIATILIGIAFAIMMSSIASAFEPLPLGGGRITTGRIAMFAILTIIILVIFLRKLLNLLFIMNLNVKWNFKILSL